MYLMIMILLNNFSTATTWLVFTKFHIDPTVEMRLRVCSNGHAPLTVIPIYGTKIIISILLQNQELLKMMILSLVAMTEWKNVAEDLHIWSGYFTQVSQMWPLGLLFFCSDVLELNRLFILVPFSGVKLPIAKNKKMGKYIGYWCVKLY